MRKSPVPESGKTKSSTTPTRGNAQVTNLLQQVSPLQESITNSPQQQAQQQLVTRLTTAHTSQTEPRQILADDQSEPALKSVYDELCQQVPSVGALTKKIGSAVRLRYMTDNELTESGGRPAFFLPAENTIALDVALHQDSSKLRRYILTELNHARNPVELQTQEHVLNTAMDALAVEYHEWMSVYLTYLESVDANQKGIEVENFYEEAFKNPGEVFFDFEAYLDMQVRMGHTRNYDETAIIAEDESELDAESDTEQWAGFELLNLLRQMCDMQMRAAPLVISAESHQQYRTDFSAALTAFTEDKNPFAGSKGADLITYTVQQTEDEEGHVEEDRQEAVAEELQQEVTTQASSKKRDRGEKEEGEEEEDSATIKARTGATSNKKVNNSKSNKK